MMKPPEGMTQEQLNELLRKGQRRYAIDGRKPMPKTPQEPMPPITVTWWIRYKRFSTKLVPLYPLLWLALGIYLLINAM